MRPILITSGATHNPIDSMRSITANASGRTGALLAREMFEHTATTVLGSPLALAHLPTDISSQPFSSTRDLEEKMRLWVLSNPNGIVVHSAAVGDYEVKAATLNQKIPSGQAEVNIVLHPTPKILPQLMEWSPNLIVISFKAAPPETPNLELIKIAQNQRIRSQSRLVFANVIGRTSHDIILVEEDTHLLYPTRAEAINALLNRLQMWVTDL